MEQQQQPQIAVDPNLAAEQAQADALQKQQLQVEAGADTASLMARYGTRLALAGTSPVAPMSQPVTVAGSMTGKV